MDQKQLDELMRILREILKVSRDTADMVADIGNDLVALAKTLGVQLPT